MVEAGHNLHATALSLSHPNDDMDTEINVDLDATGDDPAVQGDLSDEEESIER